LDTVNGGCRDNENKELIVIINGEGFEFDWQDAQEQPDAKQSLLQEKLYAEYMDNAYKALFHLGFSDQSIPLSGSVHFLRSLACTFAKALSKSPEIEFLREKTSVEPEPEAIGQILYNAPYMNGAENLNYEWVEKLWTGLNIAFSAEISAYQGSAADFLTSLNTEIHPIGRIFFHLVESKKDDYPFAFLATYSSGIGPDGKSKHLPLKNALIEYKNDNKKLLELLSTVNKASQKSAFISELLDSGDIFHPIGLTSKEAYIFLKEIPLYEEAGILCRIPNWWKNRSNSLRLSVSIGSKTPSRLGFDALVDFNARLSVGNESISVDELEKLLSATEGLAFIKGKWVEVNHEKLKETLAAYERAQRLMAKTDMSIMEAMRFQLNAAEILSIPGESCELEVTNGEWLNTVVARLTHPDEIEAVSCGEDFHAVLRSYQQRGLAWLYFMKKLGLGACLADDMGLGKTVQIIALLNHLRRLSKAGAEEAPLNGLSGSSCADGNAGREKTLLVIPASLIGNWTNEIEKFSPSLRYRILHPSENRPAADEGREIPEDCDLFITTYGMLLKYDWLKEVTWNTLILDEAQAIKNPGTRQTKAVKQLKADCRIAMTGTPIENSLSDLWSLFDFLNKGLLGSPKEFTGFTKKLKENQEGYSRLKKVVSPFILRRLKTDKAVISDLPEKIEMKTFTALTKNQAALYNALVEEIKAKLESAEEGNQRRFLKNPAGKAAEQLIMMIFQTKNLSQKKGQGKSLRKPAARRLSKK